MSRFLTDLKVVIGFNPIQNYLVEFIEFQKYFDTWKASLDFLLGANVLCIQVSGNIDNRAQNFQVNPRPVKKTKEETIAICTICER